MATEITKCIVLHPQYKLDYFCKAGWEQAWIDTVLNLMKTQFNLAYQKESSNEVTIGTQPSQVCFLFFLSYNSVYKHLL